MKKAKRLLSFVLAAAMFMGLISAAHAADTAFTDVPATHWGHAAIEKWSGAGYKVLVGDGTGKFNPDKGLTLAELASILTKTFGYTERDDSVSVTPAGAAEHVQKAVAAGVISKDAAINANVVLTREQAIKYIAVAFGITPADGSPDFVDKADFTSPFNGYVKAFQDRGYVKGDNPDRKKSSFHPQKNFTRAQIITVINNMVSDITESDVEGKTYSHSLILRKAANISNTTVKGDLIIGQGVGDGHVELENVIIEGRLIAYGGGSNTIVIKGKSQVPAVVAIKAHGEPVRIKVQDGATVREVIIAPYSSAVVNGVIAGLVVEGDAKVTLQDATVDSVTVTDGGSNVVVGKGTTIENMQIGGAATVKIDAGGAVNTATIASGNVAIVGAGGLNNARVTADAGTGVRIDTQGTTVENNSASDVTNSSGIAVVPGTTKSTPSIPAPAPSPTPSPTPTLPPPTPVPSGTASAATAAEFTAAVANAGITNIIVTASIIVNGDVNLRSGVTVTVNTGVTLTIIGSLSGSDAFLIINGAGKVNATDINNIGEGTYYGDDYGYWFKSHLSAEAVIESIKSNFTGTGEFIVSGSVTIGTSPKVFDRLSGYYVGANFNEDPLTVTLKENYTIPGGIDFAIGDNVTLIIPEGMTLNIDGALHGSNTSTVIIKSGGKIDLAEPRADLTEGTYTYSFSNGGSWGKLSSVSDAAALALAIADASINNITVTGDIQVDGSLTLRNGTTLTITSGSSLIVTGQLKSADNGASPTLVIEDGGSFSANGLTSLLPGNYYGGGDYWHSETVSRTLHESWVQILQNDFGYQGYTTGWSWKNPTTGYLFTEINRYIIDESLTLNKNCTIPENAGLELSGVSLTIPDGVTLTVNDSFGIAGSLYGSFGLPALILLGSGKVVTGSSTLSGEGTYIFYAGINSWFKEIPVTISDKNSLSAALTSTTQGAIITIESDILDIDTEITIPSGVSVIIPQGVSAASTRNITVNGYLLVDGMLTINADGLLSGSNLSVGKTGSFTGSGSEWARIFVASGGTLNGISINPSSSYGSHFRWNGSAWE